MRGRLLPRWLFLRMLGAIAFSAFYSLAFQIRGLIGPNGILPAGNYLHLVAEQLDGKRFWFAPTLLWLHAGDHALMALCWLGMAAGIALLFNLWPRLSLAVAFVCYLSFVAAAQDFSGYQSDGMLLEALFLAFFFAPSGLRPRLGAHAPPSRAAFFLLQWEWFRIYFESGMVKLISGDPQWRHLTAMDGYYQNGPLPTWIGWYLSHLPHHFHEACALATLVMELAIVWMMFLPRPFRLACFLIVTPWELVVILTANYTFLNYLVLALGVLLLDDRLLSRLFDHLLSKLRWHKGNRAVDGILEAALPLEERWQDRVRRGIALGTTAVGAVMMLWIFYATTVQMIEIPLGEADFAQWPIEQLQPFRIANRYGLFAVMTNGRYEIEFQGSNDGTTWTAYPFRYKPQALNKAPGIYAPYQPRLDWNLWFASLGNWNSYPIVPLTEAALINGSPQVLHLFAGNPFPQAPPKYVRAVLYQYWFTTIAQKRATGDWWRRKYIGVYAPEITRLPDGHFKIVQMPDELPEHD